jgi:uncharacterized protein YerC
MVRLNRNALSKKQLDDLFTQFAKAVSPKDFKHTDLVLTELLGKEERIMLAKRFAVVAMLVEGVSMYKIGQLLKLSQSTVEHISKKLQNGHFDYMLKKISKTKKDYFAFLDTLDNILHLGGILPHYNGLDRYRFLN